VKHETEALPFGFILSLISLDMSMIRFSIVGAASSQQPAAAAAAASH